MKWTEFFIRQRHTVFALIIAIVLCGFFAKQNLEISLFPDTAPPQVNVVTPYPGAAAEDVSRDVAQPIEEEFATLEGVASVKSTAQSGLSIINVQFEYGTDLDIGAVEVQNAISRIARELPPELPDSRVLKFSTSDRPVITYGLSGDELGLSEVRSLAENELKTRLQLVEGVAAVDVFGGHQRQMNIYLDRERLEATAITPEQVVGAIKKQNLSGSAGSVEFAAKEHTIRIAEEYSQARSIENTILTAGKNEVIRVKDVARVQDGAQEPDSAYRVNGRDAIALYIIKKDGSNTVSVVDAVKSEVKEMKKTFPYLEFTVADDDSAFTRRVVSGMTASIGFALILTALIILFFIISVTRSLVVALSMPLTFLSTLGLMQFFGKELNLITMSALILSIGIVVDNSIVVVENISRHRDEHGKDYYRAAVDGTSEIMLPVLAGSLTTVVVLMPLLFVEGFVGLTFGPLSETLIMAITASLFVSLTVIPLFTVLLKGRTWRATERAVKLAAVPFNRIVDLLKNFYLRILETALKRRAITMGLTLIILFIGVRLLAALGMEVLPKMDAGTFFVSLQTPPGTSLQETAITAGKIESILNKEPHVVSYNTRLGYEMDSSYLGESGAMGTNQAFISATLTSRKERQESIWEIEERLRGQIARIPGVENFIVKETGSTAVSTTAAPIDIQITGGDPKILNHLADQVVANIGDVPGAVNLYKSWLLNSPEIKIDIDEERAMQLGLTPADIMQQVFTGMEGAAASELKNEDVNIKVRYREEHRQSLEDLRQLRLSSPLGVQVPLKQVAKLESSSGPDLVTREDMQRTIDVLGYTYSRPFSHVMDDITHNLNKLPLPEGYNLEIVGEQSDLKASQKDLFFSLMVAVIGVYLVLMLQFKSFLHPFTIMTSIPLVLAGVALALLFAGKSISMAVLLGLILLAGTVVNNSILLIDYIINGVKEGLSRKQAIVEAVSARYRPIMMTALSDVAGMLPLALELSLGSERFSPLATAVIGGILASTLLTMVAIPVVYTFFADLSGIIKRFVSRSGPTI
ncbi:MAG: efflux RND transporter permease subunit [Firmicutes bacterium]|nr:efflux RND transporter permease subunit [Bacillota bacterium]